MSNSSPGLDTDVVVDGDEDNDTTGIFTGGDDLDDQDVCVDATLLQNLHTEELIYDRHRQAAVLCDTQHSCATFGHIVVFDNVPMMMKTYCALAPNGCVKRVRYVNSPRMMSRMRIATRTERLVFTTLSARYQSRTEEMVLSAIVRVGF